MHLIAGLALALRRMNRAVSLLAELAPAPSGRFPKVPREQSLANSSIAKSKGKTPELPELERGRQDGGRFNMGDFPVIFRTYLYWNK